MAQAAVPDYERMGEAYRILSEETPRLRNANQDVLLQRLERMEHIIDQLAQRLFHGQDRLFEGQNRLFEGQNRLLHRQDEVVNEIHRLERRLNSRAWNSSLSMSEVLSFPPGPNGIQVPQALRDVTLFKLTQLTFEELDQYTEFYELGGNDRDQKLRNLGQFLGCRFGPNHIL